MDFRRIARSAVTALRGLIAQPALAQSRSAASDQETQESGQGADNARKCEEDVLDAPISISVFTGRELQQRGANAPADYASYRPGAQINNATDRPRKLGLALELAF